MCNDVLYKLLLLLHLLLKLVLCLPRSLVVQDGVLEKAARGIVSTKRNLSGRRFVSIGHGIVVPRIISGRIADNLSQSRSRRVLL